MTPVKIRSSLEHLVEERLAELGCDSFVSLHRKHRDRENLFDGELCTLVNPACPDDLCFLPYGHIGTKEGYHILGTVAYNHAIRFKGFPMAPEGTPRWALIRAGSRIARRIDQDPSAQKLDWQKMLGAYLDVCSLPACGCDGTPHSM